MKHAFKLQCNIAEYQVGKRLVPLALVNCSGMALPYSDKGASGWIAISKTVTFKLKFE